MFDLSLIGLLTKGGFAVLILFVCSILSFKIFFEKIILFKGLSEKVFENISNEVYKFIKEKNFQSAIDTAKNYRLSFLFFKIKSPLSEVYIELIKNKERKKEDLEDLAITSLDIQLSKLEKGLGILATLGNISLYLGLFGTVIGIIRAFDALAGTGKANYPQLMAGIAEALIATAAGLFVAIPAVVFYNYLTKKIKLSLPHFQSAMRELIFQLKNN